MQVLRSEGEKAIPALVRAMDRKRPTLASWLMQLPFHDRFPTSIRNWAMQRTRIQELERSWVIRISGLLGAENKAVQRALEQALGDPDPSVRGSAAKALVRTHADPARTLPQLGALLSDPDPGARSDAAVAIGMYGPSANSMLASVQALTNDADMAVAFHARLAVAMIETPERVTVRTNELGDITFQYAK
jgi:HEAT repeat protein